MKRILTILVLAAVAAALAAPCAGDSLWPADGKASPYADKKAHAVGDLLTVLIVQSSLASHEAESQTNKSTSASAAEGTGLLKFFPDFGLEGKRSTAGSGSTVSKTQFTDRMTVRVTAVQPNGALQIEGTRSTVLNAEKLEARLTGVVRREDVTADNTVLSSDIADQQLVLTGKGPIAEKQRPGLISQLLHFLF